MDNNSNPILKSAPIEAKLPKVKAVKAPVDISKLSKSQLAFLAKEISAYQEECDDRRYVKNERAKMFRGFQRAVKSRSLLRIIDVEDLVCCDEYVPVIPESHMNRLRELVDQINEIQNGFSYDELDIMTSKNFFELQEQTPKNYDEFLAKLEEEVEQQSSEFILENAS